jgi:hypothetical protein
MKKALGQHGAPPRKRELLNRSALYHDRQDVKSGCKVLKRSKGRMSGIEKGIIRSGKDGLKDFPVLRKAWEKTCASSNGIAWTVPMDCKGHEDGSRDREHFKGFKESPPAVVSVQISGFGFRIQINELPLESYFAT